jgi:hypothetical protein
MRRRPVSGLGLVAGLGAWLLLAGSAAAFQFEDEAGKFSARFPAKPTSFKEKGEAATHYVWLLKLGEREFFEREFMVTYAEYTAPRVKNYDKNVMVLLKQSGGKLIHQAKVEQDGVDGREVITLLPNGAVMRQRMFQVGNRLYQVFYGGPYGTEKRAEVETFMASFKLLR